MTIHFAAARTPARSPIARALAKRATSRAANDNGDGAPDDRLMKAALRHFAEHGLSAARVARGKAQDAFFEGDRDAYTWWLGITRMLDRRMAAQFEQEAGPPGNAMIFDPVA